MTACPGDWRPSCWGAEPSSWDLGWGCGKALGRQSLSGLRQSLRSSLALEWGAGQPGPGVAPFPPLPQAGPRFVSERPAGAPTVGSEQGSQTPLPPVPVSCSCPLGFPHPEPHVGVTRG